MTFDPFDLAAGWLQETLLIPLLYELGLMSWEDISFGWALFAVYGAVQVAITLAVCLPLEKWRPVERWQDNGAVVVDVLYTLLSRVGVLPLFTFVLFYRAQVWVNGVIADQGLVPPTLETEAERWLASVAAAKAADVNPFAGSLTMVVEPRLSSTSRWYITADPAEIDGLEFAYLSGSEGPQVESKSGWDVDGVEIRVILDFGAGFVDHRGWYANAGAA